MKRPTMLVQTLLVELGRDLDLSVERDALVIKRRCEHEGLSFLTITLPILSDCLERGLEEGRFTCPSNFTRHGSLPRFLGGFFNRVFARSGELLPNPCVDSIFAIRQICRFMKKLKIGCSPEREARAITHFKAVERELGLLTPSITGRKDIILDEVSRVLWSQVFPEIDTNEIVCQHGPGVTADRRLSNERHRIQYWYDRSELTFPSDLHAFSSYDYALQASGVGDSDLSEGLDFVDIRNEPGVRVVFVPKTLTAPRVIAIEPTSMQYIQQGLLKYIVPILESHRLTRHSIRFSDQTVNQDLARRSSIDKRLATLDLKDASDRVHLALVQRIFKSSGILEFLEDARSLHATLPNGDNLILNKFASMGSAICFPVEAMVFYTLIQAAMHQRDGRRPTSQSLRYYSKRIDIYGDDIIVPVEYADCVVNNLESYGLQVNVNKSFRTSLFRESCGGDFFNGMTVKPVYARQLAPDDSRHWKPEHVMAWVSTSDQFYQLGLWSTAQAIRTMVEKVLRRRVPRSTSSKGAGVYFRSLLFNTQLRFCPDLCGWEQRRIVYTPLKRKDTIDGDATACFNKWGLASNASDYRRSFRSLSSFEERELSGTRTVLASRGRSPVLSDSPGRIGGPLRSLSGLHEEHRENSLQFQMLLGEAARVDSLQSSRVLPGPGTEPSIFSLMDEMEGLSLLDFDTSMKRGGFKSKHRWITLIT